MRCERVAQSVGLLVGVGGQANSKGNYLHQQSALSDSILSQRHFRDSASAIHSSHCCVPPTCRFPLLAASSPSRIPSLHRSPSQRTVLHLSRFRSGSEHEVEGACLPGLQPFLLLPIRTARFLCRRRQRKGGISRVKGSQNCPGQAQSITRDDVATLRNFVQVRWASSVYDIWETKPREGSRSENDVSSSPQTQTIHENDGRLPPKTLPKTCLRRIGSLDSRYSSNYKGTRC